MPIDVWLPVAALASSVSIPSAFYFRVEELARNKAPTRSCLTPKGIFVLLARSAFPNESNAESCPRLQCHVDTFRISVSTSGRAIFDLVAVWVGLDQCAERFHSNVVVAGPGLK